MLQLEPEVRAHGCRKFSPAAESSLRLLAQRFVEEALFLSPAQMMVEEHPLTLELNFDEEFPLTGDDLVIA